MGPYSQPLLVRRRKSRHYAPIIVFAAFAIDCGPHDYGLAQEVITSCATDSVDARYFNGVLGPNADTGQARTQGFAQSLARFDLPPFSCGEGIDEAYRLAYVPQRAESLIISAVRNDADRQITTLRIRNSDKTVVKTIARSLNEDEWARLTRALANFDFWVRTPYPSAAGSTHTVTVVHGSAWVIEARVNGWYHALSRVSNAREGDFDGVAQALFNLANLDVPGEFRTLQY